MKTNDAHNRCKHQVERIFRRNTIGNPLITNLEKCVCVLCVLCVCVCARACVHIHTARIMDFRVRVP